MESKFYIKVDDTTVECQLCPHLCRIKNERLGICNTRFNRNGILESLQWGVIASASLDPIEKKPLYHFYPGKMIYSIGGFGCNLSCPFCQNFEISQYVPHNIDKLRIIPPIEVVQKSKIHQNSIGIAYTFNEPTVWFEYMLDIAIEAKREGLKNVMVSNGFINPQPLNELLHVIDAFNIDLKSFSENFYSKITKGNLDSILKTLKAIRKSGKHLEISFLVIPNLNDCFEEASQMFHWIAEELGPQTVLHINAYHPAYLLNNHATKPELLAKLFNLAKDKLNNVYLGNSPYVDIGCNTICPQCQSIAIKRKGFVSTPIGINELGNCAVCNFGPIAIR